MMPYKKQRIIFIFIFFVGFHHVTRSQEESSQSWWLSSQKKPYLIGAAVVVASLLEAFAYRFYKRLYPPKTQNNINTPQSNKYFQRKKKRTNQAPVLQKKEYPENNQEFMDLVKKSDQFYYNTIKQPPTKANRIWSIAKDDMQKQAKIVEHAKNTYVIAHKRVKSHIELFIDYKIAFGNSVEKAFYLAKFLDKQNKLKKKDFYNTIIKPRFLIRRPLVFKILNNQCLLRTKDKCIIQDFDKIGTNNQSRPLTLGNYLSYEEMQLAAFLGIASPTYFINNGNINNKGRLGKEKTYTKEGVYIGLVGPQLDKPGFMDWQHMIVTQKQNTATNGYGFAHYKYFSNKDRWTLFYGEKFPTYKEAEEYKSDRFLKIITTDNEVIYLDTLIYKKRLRYVIEPFLSDANDRAGKANTKAYCVVICLGSGTFLQKIKKQQEDYMIDVYIDILDSALIDDNKYIKNISDIDFSNFANATEQKKQEIKLAGKKRNIAIHFTKRNPADILTGQDQEKLLVAMYESNNNAYPGNEYLNGNLNTSSGSAAACCSTIAELQNPLINRYVLHNDIKQYESRYF